MAFITVVTYAKPDFSIPQITKYENADSCRKDNGIALKVAKYYLNADLPNDIEDALAATRYMFVWIEASDEIILSIDKKRGPYMEVKEEALRILSMSAYFAGSIIYCQENKQKEHNFEMHYFALCQMLSFYDKNKAVLGSDKNLDKLLKDFKSGKLEAKEKKKFN